VNIMAEQQHRLMVAQAARHWSSIPLAPRAGGAGSRILRPGPAALLVPRPLIPQTHWNIAHCNIARWNIPTTHPTQSRLTARDAADTLPAGLMDRRWRI
jgi:hypothetical protein